MLRLIATFVFIGSSVSVLYTPPAFAEGSENSGPRLVEVEASDYEPVPNKSPFRFVNYRKRRSPLGVNVAVGMSQYEPGLVKNNKATTGEEVQYGSANSLTELQVSPRWNFLLGYLSLDLGIGQYSVKSQGEGFTASLVADLVRVGLTWGIDSLFSEPYLVPYGSAGFYQVTYAEQVEGVDVGNVTASGKTTITPYFAFGMNFQLNWMDYDTGKIGYQSQGIQNSFLFVEARQMAKNASESADASESKPDFSSDLTFEAGLRLEF